jgi:gentisate 1,2-dioxygenase
MSEYITAYEYEKNVNPKVNPVPILKKNIKDCDYGITFIDLSPIYNVSHTSTTPNLLASFIKLCEKDSIKMNDASQSYTNGTSNLFFVIQGDCEFVIDGDITSVSTGEILVTPHFEALQIRNLGSSDLQIYYVNDSPLLNYLGSIPRRKTFQTAKYSKEFLLRNLQDLSNPHNNRKGILLSNKDTEKIGINTITPVLWALYNELPPNTVQRPHRHNSVALDLCIHCTDSENIYTLVGDELDDQGNIRNPVKVNWVQSEMFITPPGLWHSHNNTGSTYAYIIPVQDAGILLFQRILGIELHR